MKGFSGFSAAALLLALFGAAGVGLRLGGPDVVDVIDLSPSCEPPVAFPDDAVTLTDSRFGPALRSAAARGVDRIRFYTDGCDLSGAPPAPPGVPVHIILRPRRDDVGVERVRVPSRVPVGADFAVEIVLGRTFGPPRPPVAVAIALQRDGRRIGSTRSIQLSRGQRRRILVRDRVERAGLVRYRVRVDAPVGDPVNDTAEAVARVGDRPVALVVSKRPLSLDGFDVMHLTPARVAGELSDDRVRNSIDAIVVGTPLRDPRGQQALADTVRGGAGMVFLAAEGVPPGPLDAVLPLSETPPEGRAALLLLDFSGSMQELKPELLVAVRRLLAYFAASDRVAFVAFRDEPVARGGWTPAREAAFELDALQPRGNTRLAPALREAQRLFGQLEDEHRRLFVVSDGKWGDRDDPELARLLDSMGGVHRAALFVDDDVPPEAQALFPVSLRATTRLADALERLEDTASDRRLKQVTSRVATPPAWLAGAIPGPGSYGNVIRLYPRHRGESIALRTTADAPLIAAWRPVGKVVMVAPDGVPVLPLVRAVLREGDEIGLTARREGAGLVLEARGDPGAPFVVDGENVPGRAAGPGLVRAQLDLVSTERLEVSCGAARIVVPPAAARELAGLRPCRELAAAIARDSGGRLHEEAPAAAAGGSRPAVWLTLLASAVLVLASALVRRGRP